MIREARCSAGTWLGDLTPPVHSGPIIGIVVNTPIGFRKIVAVEPEVCGIAQDLSPSPPVLVGVQAESCLLYTSDAADE